MTTSKFPSIHSYWALGIGVLILLIVAFLFWKRLQADEFLLSRFLWSVLWTYPLMVLGCLRGEGIARKLHSDYYATLGDSPAQMANLFTGWIFAHAYLLPLAALFFYQKSSKSGG